MCRNAFNGPISGIVFFITALGALLVAFAPLHGPIALLIAMVILAFSIVMPTLDGIRSLFANRASRGN